MKFKTVLHSIFYPVFFILLLLSFFFAESAGLKFSFFLFVLSILSIYWYYFGNFQKILFHKDLLIISLLFLLFLPVSLFFSSQWLFGLDTLFYYFLAFSFFFFFLSVDKELFQQKSFFLYGEIFLLLLNLLVAIFLLFPAFGESLSGMNLLLKSYGHNHYAAFLLLLLPILFWPITQKKVLNNRWLLFLDFLLIISSYTLMIFTLGRVALLIAFLQFFLLAFFFRKSFYLFRKEKYLFAILKLFFLIFISLSSLFVVVALFPGSVQESLCKIELSHKSICEPISQNIRFLYWQTAGAIFKESPIWGSGAGSFFYQSRHFFIAERGNSAYAHNIFLHNYAELGIFLGTVFLTFIARVFYLAFKKVFPVNKERVSLSFLLFISALSSLFNAIFDFDWHFLSIFSLTLIFLALILRKQERESTHLKETQATDKPFLKYFLIAISAIYSLLLLLFVLTQLLAVIFLRTANKQLTIKYLPFLRTEIHSLMRSRQLEKLDYQTLYPYYQNDPDFIDYAILEAEPLSEEKYQLLVQQSKINPKSYILDQQKSYYLLEDQGKFEFSLPLYQKLLDILDKQTPAEREKLLNYWGKMRLAKDLKILADQLYQQQRYQDSFYFYQRAKDFNPYILDNEQAAFLDDQDFQAQKAFLVQSNFDPSSFGKYFRQYSDIYLSAVLSFYQEGDLDMAIKMSEKFFFFQENAAYFTFQGIIQLEEAGKGSKESFQKYHQAFIDQQQWQDLSLPYDFGN